MCTPAKHAHRGEVIVYHTLWGGNSCKSSEILGGDTPHSWIKDLRSSTAEGSRSSSRGEIECPLTPGGSLLIAEPLVIAKLSTRCNLNIWVPRATYEFHATLTCSTTELGATLPEAPFPYHLLLWKVPSLVSWGSDCRLQEGIENAVAVD